ncbi:MAG TPA: response regulator transcription factor [Actinomycetota bacterium]|nr:response regulator transcription factor [Actinomycetota bacterium]
MSSVRIAIAEDHLVVAEALASMLDQDGFEVVGAVQSGEEIVDLANTKDPDVILMDLNLEGMDGVEATRQIVAHNPRAKILVLSMHDSQETVTQAIAAGVSGFLPKSIDHAELITAVKAVASGAGFLHPKITRPLLERVGNLANEAMDRDRLTEREMSVLEELAEGKSSRAIAEGLHIAEETVKTHLARIYRKLGVSDRVQAVALAIRKGLVK